MDVRVGRRDRDEAVTWRVWRRTEVVDAENLFDAARCVLPRPFKLFFAADVG